MGADFTTQALGDVLDFKNGKSIKPGGTGRFPVYGSNGLIGGVDEAREENAIILGRVGAYCGSVAYEPGKFWASDNTIIAYPKNHSHDVRFLAYLLGHLNLNRWAGGAAQPLLTQTVLKQVEAPVPPPAAQRKITAILSAYDDLIENCLRRIRILERMAQALYREWFVRFRFPGHEKTRLVDSPLGKVPEGWEVRPVDSFCPLVTRGVTPKYEPGSGRFVINQKVNRGSILALEELKELTTDLEVPADKFARFGDVLVNCLGEGTIGRVHFFTESHQKWAVDQHMSICRSASPVDSLYVFHALESPEGQGRITALKTGGTNMTMFNISALRSFALVAPPVMLRARFAEVALPLRQQKQLLEEANRNLRRTRDLLLPKLISGELDVSELDIAVPQGAA